jgi:superoxide oxidase
VINRTARYSSLMIIVHWSTALLVVVAYVISHGGGAENLNHPPVVHMICGLAVLLLVLPRLYGRLIGGAPPLEAIGGQWLVRFAKLGHAALYVLLTAVPLTGWYAASRIGLAVPGLGLTLPPLTAAVTGDPGIMSNLHQVGGNVLLIAAALHATMAFWHHFVRHDNTLRRMKPF